MPASCSPLNQETVQLEPAALMHEKETLMLGPLERYWNEDRRQNMFCTISPDLPPNSAIIHTNNDTPVSPYEQKLVTTRLMTPEPTKTEPPTLVVTTTSLIVTHVLPQSMSQAPPAWIPLTPTQLRTAAPVPRRILTPPVRLPSPPTPRTPSPQLAQPL